MSDITAKTMVPGFKRLPQRAYLGGYTSYFGSRTHFQLATFYALTETPDLGRDGFLSTVNACSQTYVALGMRLKAGSESLGSDLHAARSEQSGTKWIVDS